MTLLKAFAAQLLALLLVGTLAAWPVAPDFPVLALASAQGVLAATVSRLLRAPPWWVPIHLAFAPAVVVVSAFGLPAWTYLAALVALLLVYGGTFRGEAPLFLSSAEAARAVAALLPAERPLRFADVGAGTGRLLAAVAAARPQAACRGIEDAVLPYFIARCGCRGLPNCELQRENFWHHALAPYDVVYAFLSPTVMPRLWRKARAEMKPGSLLISAGFPIPGAMPERTVNVADARRTTLHCYRV